MGLPRESGETAMEALEMITGLVLRPMQGPLSFEHTVRIFALRNAPWDGKARAAEYESDVRAGRVPRL